MNDPAHTGSEPGAAAAQGGGEMRLALGEFELEPATRRLFRADGTEIHLSQKPFQVLSYLVENRNRLVTRAELLSKFWDDRDVYDQALTRCMSSVRKALDDQADPPRYIETRWAEGYRYIGPYAAAPDAGPDGAPAAAVPKGPCLHCRVMAGLTVLAVVIAGVFAYRLLGNRPPPAPAVQRIAVLPLRHDAGVDPWLAEGLGERLVNSLSRIEGLTVIARGSSKDFVGAAPDPGEIGAQLGVQAFVSGSVTLSAEVLRVSARLTSTGDGSVLWSFETEHPRVDLMSAEREVALALATRLSARLRAAPTPTHSEAAYAHYLEGRHQWNQRNEASLRAAIQHYDAALALDPDYVDAHAGRAEAVLLLPLYAGESPAAARTEAREAAEAALKLDPDAGRAHLVLAIIAQFDWDWAAADAHFQRAVAANPSDATAAQWSAESLCYRRRFDECRAGLRRARELDPLSPVIGMVDGIASRWAGDLDAAQRAYQSVRTRWPGFAFIEMELGQLADQRGEWDQAVARYRTALARFGVPVAGGQLAFAYARAGRRAEAAALRDEMRAAARDRYMSPTALAVAELGLGDVEQALGLLERAVETKDEGVLYIAVDHHYRALHDEPRFRALLDVTGLKP